jgi:chemotaxis response regulator CheB
LTTLLSASGLPTALAKIGPATGFPERSRCISNRSAIRRFLRRIVEEHPGWEVCGEAENGHDAISKAEALAPDVAVLDLAMPQMNGLEAARRIGKLSPLLPMLLLTVQEVSPEPLLRARRVTFDFRKLGDAPRMNAEKKRSMS